MKIPPRSNSCIPLFFAYCITCQIRSRCALLIIFSFSLSVVKRLFAPIHAWMLVFVVGLSSLLWFHVKYIMPQSFQYMWEKNPAFKRLEKKIDRLIDEKVK